MNAITKQTLIDRWEGKRTHLKALVNQAEAHRDLEIYRRWTLKEFLAHMSGWDDAVIAALQSLATGTPTVMSAARGIDLYNAETVTTREPLPYHHIRAEWDRSHELVMAALQELPEDKLQQRFDFPWGGSGTVEKLVQIFVDHEEEHTEHLQAWLKNPHEVILETH